MKWKRSDLPAVNLTGLFLLDVSWQPSTQVLPEAVTIKAPTALIEVTDLRTITAIVSMCERVSRQIAL